MMNNVENCDGKMLTIPKYGIIMWLHFQISIINSRIFILKFNQKSFKTKNIKKGGMPIE